MKPSKQDIKIVGTIRGMLKRGDDPAAIAKHFDVGRRRVMDIRAGRTYENVKARRKDLPDLAASIPQSWRPGINEAIAGISTVTGKDGASVSLGITVPDAASFSQSGDKIRAAMTKALGPDHATAGAETLGFDPDKAWARTLGDPVAEHVLDIFRRHLQTLGEFGQGLRAVAGSLDGIGQQLKETVERLTAELDKAPTAIKEPTHGLVPATALPFLSGANGRARAKRRGRARAD